MGETNPPVLQSSNLPTINQKSLDYEIETHNQSDMACAGRSFHVVAINDKNLDYEIETRHTGDESRCGSRSKAINDKNLDYEIETIIIMVLTLSRICFCDQ